MDYKIFIITIAILSFSSFKIQAQNSDAALQNILNEKRIYNREHIDRVGFRIQLYNGLSQNKANDVRASFVELFPEITSELIYEQPEWKVQTSTFKTRLQAYKAWAKIKESFKGTFIFEVKKK